MKNALNLRIRPSYSDDSFGYTLSLPSQFLALSAHGPECHIEHNVWKTPYVLCYLYWCDFFYMIYSTGQTNVCTDFEINRFRIDAVRTYRYATIVCFIWRHVTQKHFWYFDKEHFETKQKSLRLPVKSYGSNSGFRVFGDLDLDLWPMFYCLSHALRMMYWNIHAKFH